MPKYINGYMQTAGLLSALTLLFMLAGLLLGGEDGMVTALVFAIGINVFTYWNSDKVVLRMHGAKKANRQDWPALFDAISDLAVKAGIPMPDVYIIDEDLPNSFATGRNTKNATIAVTTGLLALLSADEISGVMAHELAHIKNRDTLVMTITTAIAGALMLAPIAAMVVQTTISRKREYEADRVGAEISGEPSWLASALGKLEKSALAPENEGLKNYPASAHMFIINPSQARKTSNLFSTHPATINRIMRLISMSAKKDWYSHNLENSKITTRHASSIPVTRD